MLRLFTVATLVAFVLAEAPLNNYGAPQQAYSAPSSGGYSGGNSNTGGYSGGGAGGLSGGSGSGSRNVRPSKGGPYESDPDLQLEDEGRQVPSEIIDQELLDKVVDALSQDLAEQAAEGARARAAQNQAYGAPSSQYGAPNSQYGAPNSQYGAPGGLSGGAGGAGGNGKIELLIPPDPLKAKLIANYIQSPLGSPSAFGPGGSRAGGAGGAGGYSQGGNSNAGGYSQGGNSNAGGYSQGGNAGGYN